MKLLIKNIDIVTSDIKNMVLKNSNIFVDEDRIVRISESADAINGFSPEKVIDGKGKLAVPGLVNAHTHSPMTILRNYANDLSLENWLFDKIFPAEAKLTPQDVYWGSLLGIAEMISSGTTSFADMYYFVENTARAVMDSGIRANLSCSAYGFKFEEGNLTFYDNTKEFKSLYDNYSKSSDGRLKVYVLVHSPYIYDIKSMSDSANVAKEFKTGIHIHLLESAKERRETFEKYKESSVIACKKAGIFDIPCISAHCVHLDDEEIQILAENNVSIAHNPTSNLKLGSGIARIPTMQKAGINIGLGTDGPASNNNLNMFEEINLVALIHKGYGQDPLLVNANDAFIMGTYGGAVTIGFNEVGQLIEGKKADITIVDIDKIHYVPYNNPISSLVYAGQASDVETVIIDGKIVYENKEFKTIDIELAKSKVKEIIKKIQG